MLGYRKEEKKTERYDTFDDGTRRSNHSSQGSTGPNLIEPETQPRTQTGHQLEQL